MSACGFQESNSSLKIPKGKHYGMLCLKLSLGYLPYSINSKVKGHLLKCPRVILNSPYQHKWSKVTQMAKIGLNGPERLKWPRTAQMA